MLLILIKHKVKLNITSLIYAIDDIFLLSHQITKESVNNTIYIQKIIVANHNNPVALDILSIISYMIIKKLIIIRSFLFNIVVILF